MAKIYLAGRNSRVRELQSWAIKLKEHPHLHSISSSWMMKPPANPEGVKSKTASNEDRKQFATQDIWDLLETEWLIFRCEPERSDDRGGRHVEMGINIGLTLAFRNVSLSLDGYVRRKSPDNNRTILIGCGNTKENVFHTVDTFPNRYGDEIPLIEWFDTFEEFIDSEYNRRQKVKV